MTKLGLMHCIIRREYLQWRMFTHVSPMFHFYGAPPPPPPPENVKEPSENQRFPYVFREV